MHYLIAHVSVYTLCIVFTSLCVLIAWAGLYVTRKYFKSHHLEKNHAVAASVYEIAGIIYSLILAFVIIAVWSSYERLDHSIELEGAKLGNIIVHAAQLNDTMEDYIKKENLGGAQLIDENWEHFAKKYQINAIPRFMLIDRQGKWIEIRCPRPSDKEALKAYLDKALKK